MVGAGVASPWAHPIEAVRADVLSRQRAALVRVGLGSCPPGVGSRAQHVEEGLSRLHRTIAGTPQAEDALTASMELLHRDPVFGFLADIPGAVGTAIALSEALEVALFGHADPQSADLAALLGAFNVVLDGLVDESPEHLAPVRDALRGWTSVSALEGSSDTDISLAEGADHPVVVVMALIARGWIGRVRGGSGWRSDASIRTAFARAASQAVRAELESAAAQRIADGPVDLEQTRGALAAKSEWAMVAHGLAPLCIRGAPEPFDLDAYQDCLRRLGRYGGWLDDVRDLGEDLAARIWSSALVEVAAPMGAGASHRADDWRSIMECRLAYSDVRQHLADVGAAKYTALQDSLSSARLDCPEMRALIGQVTESYLDGGGP